MNEIGKPKVTKRENHTRSHKSGVIKIGIGPKVGSTDRGVFENKGKDVIIGLPLEFILIVHDARVQPDMVVHVDNGRITLAVYGKT